MNKVLAIILTLSCTALFAQDKKMHRDLPKNYTIAESIFLGDNGFFLRANIPVTASYYPNIFYYFNSQADLIWEKKLKGELAGGENYMAASPGGDYMYFIEMKGFPGKSHYITQILKSGKESVTKIEAGKEYGNSLLAIFCDDQYLYYLASQNGDEQHSVKKSLDKIILNRFDHNGLTYKRIVLDLPLVAPGEGTSFWSFMGQRGDEKFLVSKNIEIETGKSTFDIVAFNAESKVIKKPSIAFSLSDKFNRPAWNVSKKAEIITDVDYEIKISRASAPNVGTTITTRSVPMSGAFGFVLFDVMNNNFYLYGLTGPKPHQRVGPVYDGFYIAKYDEQGSQLWNLQYAAPKKLMEEGTFRVHGLPSDRDIALKVLPNEKLNFSIHFKDKLFEFEIGADGNMQGMRDREGVLDLTGYLFSTKEKLKSEEFIKRNEAGKKSKTISYTNAINSSGEIVIKTDSKESTFDLYYFKK